MEKVPVGSAAVPPQVHVVPAGGVAGDDACTPSHAPSNPVASTETTATSRRVWGIASSGMCRLVQSIRSDLIKRKPSKDDAYAVHWCHAGGSAKGDREPPPPRDPAAGVGRGAVVR